MITFWQPAFGAHLSFLQCGVNLGHENELP
jgi:hypothetical protein